MAYDERMKWGFLLFMLINIPMLLIEGSPPEDPIKCGNSNCTVTNSIGAFPDRSICRAAEAIYPRTEAEVVSAVAKATREGRKVKVTTRYSHSIPKLVCPDGGDGILISTRNLNRVVGVNVSAMTMTVESGVTLREVIQEAAKWQLALPYAPYWWGLTVGGMIGTGAHGSSLWGLGSQVHDYVVKLRIVTPAPENDGYATVRTLENGQPDMDAVKVSLGVLGVISEVTLKLQPLFKRSMSYITRNDSDLGDEALTFGRRNEFADLTWYPSQKRVIYRVDNRVSNNVTGNGVNDFVGFRSTSSVVLAGLRTTEEAQELLRDVNGKCISGRLTTASTAAIGYGFTNNGILFTGYPIIGNHNRMQSSGSCLDSPEDSTATACPWDPRVKGIFYHQTTFCVSLTRVKSFIDDVKKLVDLNPSSFCGLDLYSGIWMRYVTSSTAYLGKKEDCIDFDITYYRSKDPLTPRLNEDVFEEIEQMAIFKYGALAHWGKNRNIAFQGAINKFPQATEFLNVKRVYDPSGIFSSDWTDQILGLKAGLSINKPGCALEGLCICSDDSHCAPGRRYYCRPGKIYPAARVCEFVRN